MNKKEVIVYYGTEFPDNLVGFGIWLGSLIDTVPYQYLNDCQIHIDYGNDECGDYCADINISYWRDPTALEEAEDVKRELLSLIEREKREMLQLKLLKEKYEGKQ